VRCPRPPHHTERRRRDGDQRCRNVSLHCTALHPVAPPLGGTHCMFAPLAPASAALLCSALAPPSPAQPRRAPPASPARTPCPQPLPVPTDWPPPACPPRAYLHCCRYEGKYAVVAMPPWLTGRITYDPPLPRQRNQVAQRTPMGAVVKVRAGCCGWPPVVCAMRCVQPCRRRRLLALIGVLCGQVAHALLCPATPLQAPTHWGGAPTPPALRPTLSPALCPTPPSASPRLLLPCNTSRSWPSTRSPTGARRVCRSPSRPPWRWSRTPSTPTTRSTSIPCLTCPRPAAPAYWPPSYGTTTPLSS